MSSSMASESVNSACSEVEIMDPVFYVVVAAEKNATVPDILRVVSPCSAFPADEEMPTSMPSTEEMRQTSQDLGWISCESEVIQKSCSISLSATSNWGFTEALPISRQADESKISAEHNMDVLEGVDTLRSKAFQSQSDEESSLEILDTEIVSRQDSHANQIGIEQADSHKESDKEVLPDEHYVHHSESTEYSIHPYVCSEEQECSSSGIGGIGVLKHVIGIRDAINSSTQYMGSHINWTPYRKSSPLNWFPRRKTESYLERKIRMLQEAEGMNATLDETLGDSNPHLSRIEREKLAAQAAAGLAMQARKAALVEASWCRILKAARIPCTLAEVELQKAEKNAAEAFDAATALGVVMRNKSGSPKQSFEVETLTTDGNSTHTVSASFETAFEVDREVAGALKEAFLRLAHLPSSAIKDIFGTNEDACIRLTLNPDGKDTQSDNNSICLDCVDKACSSEMSSESDAQTEGELQTDSELERDFDVTAPDVHAIRTRKHAATQKYRYRLKRSRSKQIPAKEVIISEELIQLMLDRVKLLKEDELVSLAMIVATRGLSAMLKEQRKEQELDDQCSSGGLGDILVKHISRLEAQKAEAVAAAARAVTVAEDTKKKSSSEIIPDLGSILVKHVSKFEREVQEAKKLAKARQTEDHIGELKEQYAEGLFGDSREKNSFKTVPALGSILVKHVSKFERDVQAAKDLMKKLQAEKHSVAESKKQNGENLDKVLVKKASTEEREKITKPSEPQMDSSMEQSMQINRNVTDDKDHDKENKDVNTSSNENNAGAKKTNLDSLEPGNDSDAEKIQKLKQQQSDENSKEGLDKILVRHVSRLEKEKLAASALAKEASQGMPRKKQQHDEESAESLDEVLLKHISKLEKEKLEASAQVEDLIQSLQKKQHQHDGCEESLDKVLVKHSSKLEKEKLMPSTWAKDSFLSIRRKQHQPDMGEESLDKILVRHISKLEKEKLVASVSEKEASQKVQRKQHRCDRESEDSLDKILVKKMSRLEIEKQQQLQLQQLEAATVPATTAAGRKTLQSHRNARAQEIQAAWGGLSLGNCLKRHVSRLELDKAAWREAEEKERRRTSSPPKEESS